MMYRDARDIESYLNMRCCTDARIVRINRTWFQRLFYSGAYKCTGCGSFIKI